MNKTIMLQTLGLLRRIAMKTTEPHKIISSLIFKLIFKLPHFQFFKKNRF